MKEEMDYGTASGSSEMHSDYFVRCSERGGMRLIQRRKS